MASRLPSRILHAVWKPVSRAGRATGRSLATFFGAGWQGLTLACLGVFFGLFGLMGAFLRTGLWRPLDVVLALVLAALAAALGALVVLLLRLMFRKWPARFLYWGLGSFLLAWMFMSFRGGPGIGFGVVGLLSALLGGFGLSMAVLFRPRLPRAYRIVAAVLLLGALAGSVTLVRWIAQRGTDAHLETQVPATSPAVPALDLPDPSLPGAFPVKALTYGSGTDRRRPEYGAGVAFRTETVDASPFLKNFKGFKARMRTWYWGFGKEAFPLNGRVYYPEGKGPFPLVLCVHGNHAAQDFSDPGYAYLGERLASRGFIFVSVDENFLNGGWDGGIDKENAVRGWMLLKHLEAWRRWSQQAGHPFAGKVDLDRISLIGHSRGGEAVAIAAAYNRLTRWPEDATQKFDFGFRIRSVIAIAPIDGQYETSDVATPVRDVDYLVLQGSHDADVCFFAGQRTYRRVAFTDGQPHFKTTLFIHRANHSQFNTAWGDSDMGQPFGVLLARGALLPAEDQRRIAQVAIGAFLEATLRDQRGYQAFFRDPRSGAAWLPRTILLNQYEDERFQPLATFEEDIDPCTTTLPGGRIQAEHFTLWKERQVRGRTGFNFRHKGTWLGWERTGTQTAIPTYAIDLPPAFEPGRDTDARLLLTLADTDENPHVEKEGQKKDAPKKTEPAPDTKPKPKDPVDFTVELVARDGRVAALPLSVIRPLQPVVKVRLTKWDRLENTAYESAWEPVFQTFELPLTAFEQAAPGFKAEALRTIRLRFDRSEKGVVILDQVGFTR